ncbi:hypothetical protein Poly51_17440 [Rubripirellula tenax]|uniref:Replication-relaxation n=2 Tax=Rubripirellula TaxID=1579505 RepID=A0A5C6FAX1_9BACT|nr:MULTISPECIES: dienelactone hydrolase family protein [Rubripirellula]TWU56012.1 hypothetical protein Poly59_23150 [Rubripirellula reticaptiva]TWU58963.1 hypothetical protein Poly51_17440 [Rubripirellula tenax]
MARRKPTQHNRAVRGKTMDRDLEILDHVRVYGLTTRDVLHRLFFDDSQLNAVTKVTTRLIRNGLLERHKIDHESVYYSYGPAACDYFGYSRNRTGGFGSQALPTRLAILEYCSAEPQIREKLTRGKIDKTQPKLLAKKVDAKNYFLEVDPELGTKRLGLIVVCLGGPVDHAARKCKAEIDKRLEVPAFQQLIENRLFFIVMLTPSQAKADTLAASIKRRQFPVSVRVEPSRWLETFAI